jgi:hypothetical protein
MSMKESRDCLSQALGLLPNPINRDTQHQERTEVEVSEPEASMSMNANPELEVSDPEASMSMNANHKPEEERNQEEEDRSGVSDPEASMSMNESIDCLSQGLGLLPFEYECPNPEVSEPEASMNAGENFQQGDIRVFFNRAGRTEINQVKPV